MRPETKKIGILTTRQLLLTLFDIGMEYVNVFLAPKDRSWRCDMSEYRRWRKEDRERVAQQIYHLKKQKFIRPIVENKVSYLELTPKGRRIVFGELLDKVREKNRERKWDKKWRMVIFDIPNDKRDQRDDFRHFLNRLGFYQLQESVYISPFDCFDYVNAYAKITILDTEIKYIVADIIQGEEEIIETLLERGILDKSQLKE